jgi:hypothetical protein
MPNSAPGTLSSRHGAKTLLADLDAAIAADMALDAAGSAWAEATHSDLLKSARTLYRLALERQKPDAQREAGYQERDLSFIKARLTRLEQSFVPASTRPASPRPEALRGAAGQSMHPQGLDALLPKQALDALYKSTELGDTAKRLALDRPGRRRLPQVERRLHPAGRAPERHRAWRWRTAARKSTATWKR